MVYIIEVMESLILFLPIIDIYNQNSVYGNSSPFAACIFHKLQISKNSLLWKKQSKAVKLIKDQDIIKTKHYSELSCLSLPSNHHYKNIFFYSQYSAEFKNFPFIAFAIENPNYLVKMVYFLKKLIVLETFKQRFFYVLLPSNYMLTTHWKIQLANYTFSFLSFNVFNSLTISYHLELLQITFSSEHLSVWSLYFFSF